MREGLHFNKPVVASDAVKRPAAADLFTDRDADSFAQVIDKVIAQKETPGVNNSDSPQPDFVEFYKNIYMELS